jgi:hypothetical protein
MLFAGEIVGADVAVVVTELVESAAIKEPARSGDKIDGLIVA